MKTFALFLALNFFSVIYSQTFTGGSGPILDLQTIEVPAIVNLTQTSIDTVNFGLQTLPRSEFTTVAV